MSKNENDVCPVERAGGLDTKLRRWLQNPRKILKPYVSEGMTVLDVGCGPGFFTIDMAQMVGPSGQVIALDLQQGMLDKVREKISGTELENRITLHKAEADAMNLTTQVDFALLFYMVHEVPDARAFLTELISVLKPGGHALIVEPPMHVSRKDFEGMKEMARDLGYSVEESTRVNLSKSVVLRNG